MNKFLFSIFLSLFFTHPVFAKRKEEQKILNAIERNDSKEKKFDLMIGLAYFYKNSDISKADSMKNVLVNEAYILDVHRQFKAAIFQIEMDEIMGDKFNYIKHVTELLQFKNSLTNTQEKFQFHKHLGIANQYDFKLDLALNYFEKAEKYAITSRKNASVANINNLTALYFMHLNNKDKAIFHSNIALKYARRTNQKIVTAECFNVLAEIYAYFGQVELSVAKNIIGLEIAQGQKNFLMMAKIAREIGESQRIIFNLDDASYYFNQSLEYAIQIKDYRQVGLAYSNIGMVAFDKKDIPKAISDLQKAKSYLSKYNDFNALGELYNDFGLIFLEQKNYPKALNHFNQSLIYHEANANKLQIAKVYHNVGYVFLKQKKYNNAINYLKKSIQISQTSGSRNQLYATFRVLSKVYKSKGDVKNASLYMEKYIDFLDSNTTNQAATKIAELSESYRYDQREKLIQMQADSIERQKQEKTIASKNMENAELKNEFQRYVIIGFFIMILLGGIIIFYRFNQIDIKRKQKEAEMSQTLLRAQMNPHFVFNAMSVIQSYIYDNDTEKSSRFLVNFSRLMRLILENSPKEFIPIETEVEILEKYLAMQKLRFENRFDYLIKVEDVLYTEHASLPPMITQPFIENAIEHGQLHTIEKSYIHVVFKKHGQMLNIEIEDNGIGRKGSEMNKKSKAHKSMAMSITKERIENINQKYKKEGFFSIEDLDKIKQSGTKILISLPYQLEN